MKSIINAQRVDGFCVRFKRSSFGDLNGLDAAKNKATFYVLMGGWQNGVRRQVCRI